MVAWSILKEASSEAELLKGDGGGLRRDREVVEGPLVSRAHHTLLGV